LRELTRYRSTLVQDRARALNRLQAVLELTFRTLFPGARRLFREALLN
jgi:hypothetical protein